MSTSITLTYPEIHPGVVTSFTPGWTTTASEIFRRVLDLARTHVFQITVETIALLSIFTAVTVWVLALSSGKVTNPQIFLGS